MNEHERALLCSDLDALTKQLTAAQEREAKLREEVERLKEKNFQDWGIWLESSAGLESANARLRAEINLLNEQNQLNIFGFDEERKALRAVVERLREVGETAAKEADREVLNIGASARRGDQSKAETFRFVRDSLRKALAESAQSLAEREKGK